MIRCLRANRCHRGSSTSAAGNTCEFHQTCGLVAADMKAFTVHGVPHFADAVDREVFRMHTLYLWDEQAIA